jgi:hypothetical protein
MKPSHLQCVSSWSELRLAFCGGERRYGLVADDDFRPRRKAAPELDVPPGFWKI